jgi:hypothetical protein
MTLIHYCSGIQVIFNFNQLFSLDRIFGDLYNGIQITWNKWFPQKACCEN